MTPAELLIEAYGRVHETATAVLDGLTEDQRTQTCAVQASPELLDQWNERLAEVQGGLGDGPHLRLPREPRRLGFNDGVIVPQGARHNVKATGDKPLKLYTIYGPPEHIDGTVHATCEDAHAAHEHEKTERREWLQEHEAEQAALARQRAAAQAASCGHAAPGQP